MKLAFLARGDSIHTLRWVNALASRGHNVHLISSRQEVGELHPSISFHKLPHKPPLGYFLNVRVLKRILAEVKPQLLHTHFASGYGTLGRLSGFHPNILSVWGSDVYDFPKKSPVHHWLIKTNLEAADWVCSTSHVMAEQTKTIYPAPHLSVTPFGIDMKLFTPCDNQTDLIVLGTVKTLAPKYGIDLLIEAFAKLHEIVDLQLAQRLRLKIVGGGPQEKELIELAQTLAVKEQIEFVGQVPHHEVVYWLNKLDIYVALSRLESESFGVAVLEASACALPVLVSNEGGLPEVVKDGVTGFVVAKENVAEAAEALTKLVCDASLRQRMGAAGRAHVLEHYDWEQSVSIMEDVYRQVLARNEI